LSFLRRLAPFFSVVYLAGCNDQVPLGSWGKEPGQKSEGAPLPECLAAGTPGPTTPGGAGVAVTVPFTDWVVPTPYEAIELELRIETETVADGDVWAFQVPFAGGANVLFGLQSLGGYQADPPNGPVVRTKIAQFWASGPPLEAELGDIPYPDARAYLSFEVGSEWWTINALYDWQACRTYRLRLAPDGVEAGRGTWYAGSIIDTQTLDETLLGRMLLSDAQGAPTTPVSTWSNRIGWAPLVACSNIEPASAIFGVPEADGLRSSSRRHRFAEPLSCDNTRFVDFEGGVRQAFGDVN
jgi:hypothetical protein